MFTERNQVDNMMENNCVKHLQNNILAAIFLSLSLVHMYTNTTYIYYSYCYLLLLLLFFTKQYPFVSPERFHSMHSFETSLR